MSAKAKDLQDKIEVDGELVTGGLTLPDTEAALFVELKKSGERITEIEKDWAEVPDVETKEGMKLAKSRRAECVSMRTSGDGNRLLITQPLRALTDAVNKLWNKDYQPRLKIVEKKYDDAIKAVEQRVEREKREKAEANQKRIDGIESMIAKIKAAPAGAVTVEEIDEALEIVNGYNLDDFDEFRDAAEMHIDAARDVMTDRRASLKAQAEEAARLAEQKAEQDRIAAEQQEAADKLEAERLEMEQWKAEQAEREAQDKREAEEKEEARTTGLKSGIAEIQSAADRLDTIASIDAYLDDLEYGNENDFDEFKDEAAHAMANAKIALTEKRRQLIEKAEQEAQAAEEQRLADIKAAEQAGAKRERERKAAEAAKRKAAKAEAARLKKLEPEVEQLRSYIQALQAVEAPALNSAEVVEALETISDQLQDMTAVPDSLISTKAA